MAYDADKDRLVKKLPPLVLASGEEFHISLREYDKGGVKAHVDRVKKNKVGQVYKMRPGRLTRDECELLGNALADLAADKALWK